MKSNSFENFMNEKVLPLVNKFTNLKFVKCMTQGVVACMNATMVGSIFMLLMNPPFPASTTNFFVDAWRNFAAANAAWLNVGYQLTLNAAALYIVIGMALATCKEEKAPTPNNVVLSVATYLCLQCTLSPEGLLNIGFLGAKGMMAALVVGFVVPELNLWFKKHGLTIKMPESVPTFVSDQLEDIISSICTIAVMFAIKLVLGHFGFTLGSFINGIFSPLFSASDNLITVIIWAVLVRILWFFGIHGGNVSNAVIQPILMANLLANAEAVANGQKATTIFNAAFSNWGNFGILFIIIAMLIVCRSKQLKAVSRVAIVPALFNIGEPLTFGLPIVLNFNILLPYLAVFVVCVSVPYIATMIGFMNPCYVNLPYTIPGIVKAFLMNMDPRSIVVYLITGVICILIMIPSLKKYDKQLLAQEAQSEETK